MPRSRLFGVKVGCRRAVVDIAHAVGCAGVVQDALGGRRLAGIDVGDDADVANALRSVWDMVFNDPVRPVGLECEDRRAAQQVAQRPRPRHRGPGLM